MLDGSFVQPCAAAKGGIAHLFQSTRLVASLSFLDEILSIGSEVGG
jgi:hypothetical protein